MLLWLYQLINYDLNRSTVNSTYHIGTKLVLIKIILDIFNHSISDVSQWLGFFSLAFYIYY